MTAAQWDFADPFLWQVTVQAEHIDALAHTRNTHYVEYGSRLGAYNSGWAWC